jgi:hypothetical protein
VCRASTTGTEPAARSKEPFWMMFLIFQQNGGVLRVKASDTGV